MRQVNWGVLGTAGIARSATIPAMLEADNCRLYAIAGRSVDKARRFQADFGFEKAYGSFEELLADPEVEAVYIPLPNDLHREWTVRALNAKKHVLCEKPLALNETEARGMFDAAAANGVCLMEAYAYLHTPFIAQVKEALDSGVIGEVRYLESAFLGGLPKAGDYRWRKEAGGGAIYDLGCYASTMALWMLGREPAQVQATAQFNEQGIDLFSSALFRYENGAVANLDCGMLANTNRLDRFHILGTRGEICSPIQFNQAGDIPLTIIHDGRTETRTIRVLNNYRLEVEQLGRCVLEGETPHVSRDFSLMAARTLDRWLKAAGYRQ